MEFHKLALALNCICLLSLVYACLEKISVMDMLSQFSQANRASVHIFEYGTTFFVVFVLPILNSVIVCRHTSFGD